jgi:hypothetical protein
MTAFRTRSEIRLDELEAFERPLTASESNELRKCLHAIYMRNWRIAQSIEGRVGGELLDVHKAATLEVNAIATRMIASRDDGWLPPKTDDWMEQARQGSERLRAAIVRAYPQLAA